MRGPYDDAAIAALINSFTSLGLFIQQTEKSLTADGFKDVLVRRDERKIRTSLHWLQVCARCGDSHFKFFDPFNHVWKLDTSLAHYAYVINQIADQVLSPASAA